MSIWVLEHEPVLRLFSFSAIFIMMVFLEWLAPDRVQRHPRSRRWPVNIGLVVVSNLAVRVLFPIAAVGIATWSSVNHVGLLSVLHLPRFVELILAIVILDGAIWLQHVASHRIPLLWRLHLVHHTDLDLDVTSGTRFHPIEIVFSLLYKMLVVLALGPSAVAVVLFEILLNAMAVFNHANVALPHALDSVLRWVIVTPDVHRTHHSVIASEGHANFGFNLVIWDRLFGTYVHAPKRPLVLGLPHRQGTPPGLSGTLALPFTLPAQEAGLASSTVEPSAV